MNSFDKLITEALVSTVPTTLDELKRFLKVGSKLKLTYHANPKAQWAVGKVREIHTKKGNELGIISKDPSLDIMQGRGGYDRWGNVPSWLTLDDTINTFKFSPTGFSIVRDFDDKPIMTYEYVN